MKIITRRVIISRKRIKGRDYEQALITLPKEFSKKVGNEVKLIVTDFFLVIYPNNIPDEIIKELVIRSLGD